MRLFRDYGNPLADGVARVEHERIEEVLMLRRLLAVLVLKAGGQTKVEIQDIVALPRETELTTWIDERGDYHFQVS